MKEDKNAKKFLSAEKRRRGRRREQMRERDKGPASLLPLKDKSWDWGSRETEGPTSSTKKNGKEQDFPLEKGQSQAAVIIGTDQHKLIRGRDICPWKAGAAGQGSKEGSAAVRRRSE